MIKLGCWYYFEHTTDKLLFINIARKQYADTIDNLSEAEIDELLTKALLRVSPHGHHINYRTDYNPMFQKAIMFDPEQEAKQALNSIYGKKETDKMNELKNNCCIAADDTWCCNVITDELVRKYYLEDREKIRQKADKAETEIRMNSDVAKSLEKFFKIMEARKVQIMFSIQDNMLCEEDQKKIKDLDAEKEAELQKAFDKAFECCKLLERTHTSSEYKSVLESYGYLRKDILNEKD